MLRKRDGTWRNGMRWAPRGQRPRSRRRGAILSVELLVVLPLLVGLSLAVVEMSMLSAGQQRVQSACHLGCRVATLPAFDPQEREHAVRQAVERALGKRQLIDVYKIKTFKPGLHTGDPVVLEVSLPANAAAPDMLGLFGIGLKNRVLSARMVMRKE